MKVTVKVDVRKDIARLKAAAGKDAPRVLKEFMLKHARALVSSSNKKFPGLIQVTPPLIKFGSRMTGKEGRIIGETAVSAGINRVYGGPGKLYEKLRKKDKQQAAIFWRMIKGFKSKKSKGWDTAEQIAMNNGLPGFSSWDGGALHSKLKKKMSRGRIRDDRNMVFLRDKPSGKKDQSVAVVNRYIRKKQKFVGLLAGAILDKARARFGEIKNVPPWVKRHHSSWADCNLYTNGQKLTIRVVNSAPYQMKDLKRLYDWAAEGRIMAMKLDIKHAARALEKKLKADLAAR